MFDIDIDAIITPGKIRLDPVWDNDDVVIDSNSEIISYHVITETGPGFMTSLKSLMLSETITLFDHHFRYPKFFLHCKQSNTNPIQHQSKWSITPSFYLYPHQLNRSVCLLMKYQPRRIADEGSENY